MSKYAVEYVEDTVEVLDDYKSRKNNIFLIEKIYDKKTNRRKITISSHSDFCYKNELDPIEKFLYYRFVDDRIDVDVCSYNMKLYETMCENIFKNTSYSLEKQSVNLELKISGKINNMGFANNNEYFVRGETVVNAMSSLQQLYMILKDEKICKKGEENLEKYLDFVKCLKNYKELFELMKEHILLCYSFGNFYPIIYRYSKVKRGEFSLNRQKALYSLEGNGCKFDDVMSSWLKEMKKYIEEAQCENQKTTDLLNNNYNFWFAKYRKSTAENTGWKQFITDFKLKAFCEENNEPRQFWKEPKEDATKEERLNLFKDYITNINAALVERNEDLIEFLNS